MSAICYISFLRQYSKEIFAAGLHSYERSLNLEKPESHPIYNLMIAHEI